MHRPRRWTCHGIWLAVRIARNGRGRSGVPGVAWQRIVGLNVRKGIGKSIRNYVSRIPRTTPVA